MEYANEQCNQDVGDYRSIIVCQVLINKVCRGNYGMKIPSNGYDTSGDANGNVFVKYYDDEFYPRYLINYRIRDPYCLNSLRDALPY